jgi:predicted transcriptional regulator
MRLHEAEIILEATCLTDYDPETTEINKACAADLLSDVLALTQTGTLLLTGLVHSQVIRTAEMLDLAAIVVVRGKQPSQEMIDLAKEKQIPLFSTPLNMYVAVGRLYSAQLSGEDK